MRSNSITLQGPAHASTLRTTDAAMHESLFWHEVLA